MIHDAVGINNVQNNNFSLFLKEIKNRILLQVTPEVKSSQRGSKNGHTSERLHDDMWLSGWRLREKEFYLFYILTSCFKVLDNLVSSIYLVYHVTVAQLWAVDDETGHSNPQDGQSCTLTPAAKKNKPFETLPKMVLNRQFKWSVNETLWNGVWQTEANCIS